MSNTDRVITIDSQGHSDDPNYEFASLLVSGYKGETFLSQTQINKMIDWINSVPRNHPQFKDPYRQKLDIIQLGFISAKGKRNPKKVMQASEYIFAEENKDKTPNYWELLKFLKGKKITGIEENSTEIPEKKSTSNLPQKPITLNRKSPDKIRKTRNRKRKISKISKRKNR